jgi:hypothetical protein
MQHLKLKSHIKWTHKILNPTYYICHSKLQTLGFYKAMMTIQALLIIIKKYTQHKFTTLTKCQIDSGGYMKLG